MNELLYGQCRCGGTLTIRHLQNECPLRPQQDLSNEDKAKIRLMVQRAFNKIKEIKVIKPTIGRVVWYWKNIDESLTVDAQPCAALVTFVHNDELVNLALFNRNGDHYPVVGVPLYQGEGERPNGHHCEWMPYQKGQAAKVEFDTAGAIEKLSERIAKLEGEWVKQATSAAGQNLGLGNSPTPPPSK